MNENGEFVALLDGGKLGSIWRKASPTATFPPQFPDGLAWDWTWTFLLRGLQLTAWLMANSIVWTYMKCFRPLLN